MKTKEEIIKEAWIDVFRDKKINQIITNANKLTGFLEGFMLRNFKLDIKNEKLEKFFDGVVYNYRPKSLQGIEDNNGWIRIESEEDLPKGTIQCVVCFFDGKNYLEGDIKYRTPELISSLKQDGQITHYKPIEKPKPPVY